MIYLWTLHLIWKKQNTVSKDYHRSCPILTLKTNKWTSPKFTCSSDALVKSILYNWTGGSALLKKSLPGKLNLTMDSGNESTAESTKIRVIAKWLNWDTASEKVKLQSVRNLLSTALRKLLWTNTCCWQGKLELSWQCQLIPKFTIHGVLINNKRENNSGDLHR